MTLGPLHLHGQPEPIVALSEALAEALDAAGDATGAGRALDLAIRHAPRDQGLALRLAERALAQGDAASALERLAAAWEGGADDPRVESTLALCALALGLDDVAAGLTEPPSATPAHAIVRLVLAASRGEAVDLRPHQPGPELVWGLRTALLQLAACGRTDLVHHAREAATRLRLPGADGALAAVPATPPPTRANRTPPLARQAFRAAWTRPATDAAFNWAWAAGREVAEGERVLLLCPEPAAVLPMLGHARVTAVATAPGPGVQVVAAPEALPVRAARFEHVIALYWMADASDPGAALDELWRVLTHGGRAHLLCAGPAAPGRFDLRLSLSALDRLCRRRFAVLGAAARDARGLDVPEPAEAVVHLMRVEKRVV